MLAGTSSRTQHGQQTAKAMLATMGYITPEVVGKFPGFLSPSAGLKYADIPNGLAAISKARALTVQYARVDQGPWGGHHA